MWRRRTIWKSSNSIRHAVHKLKIQVFWATNITKQSFRQSNEESSVCPKFEWFQLKHNETRPNFRLSNDELSVCLKFGLVLFVVQLKYLDFQIVYCISIIKFLDFPIAGRRHILRIHRKQFICLTKLVTFYWGIIILSEVWFRSSNYVLHF